MGHLPTEAVAELAQGRWAGAARTLQAWLSEAHFAEWR